MNFLCLYFMENMLLFDSRDLLHFFSFFVCWSVFICNMLYLGLHGATVVSALATQQEGPGSSP